MPNRFIIIQSLLFFTLIGCKQDLPSDPVCRIDQKKEQSISANAGCLIRIDDKLLTIVHKRSGRYDIPGGTSSNNESAQCTAHRETWEETGFNVEVGELLGVNENGFHYFSCSLNAGFDGKITEFPVPKWSESEVKAIQLVDPFVLTDKQWRFENRLVNLRSMFNQVDKRNEQQNTPKKAAENKS